MIRPTYRIIDCGVYADTTMSLIYCVDCKKDEKENSKKKKKNDDRKENFDENACKVILTTGECGGDI